MKPNPSSSPSSATAPVLDAEAIERALRRIAHEIIERNPDLGSIVLAGIPSRGVEIASRLADIIESLGKVRVATGAIIVTTPQEVALIDARKAATMFDKVNVTVLGLIENMSYFACPGDGKRYDIFGSGGGEREAKRLRVPLLGQIPIDIATRESGDRGMPITAESGDSPVAAEFMKIAARLRERLP